MDHAYCIFKQITYNSASKPIVYFSIVTTRFESRSLSKSLYKIYSINFYSHVIKILPLHRSISIPWPPQPQPNPSEAIQPADPHAQDSQCNTARAGALGKPPRLPNNASRVSIDRSIGLRGSRLHNTALSCIAYTYPRAREVSQTRTSGGRRGTAVRAAAFCNIEPER